MAAGTGQADWPGRRRFGPVTVISGSSGSAFPFCTTLLVDAGRERVLIDPGAGGEALRSAVGADSPRADGIAADGARAGGAAGSGPVTTIINTHYHFDHIWGNHLFPEAELLLNEVERECFPDLEAVGTRLGIREVRGDRGVDDWIRAVSTGGRPQAPHTPAFRREWWLSTRRVAGTYPYGEFNLGRVRVVMVHSPGHTAGFACPYFPDEGLVYTGDVDLTHFGPWYAGSDGDIDAFVRSARALLDLDAEWYVTGHQEGVLRRDEFAERLGTYLEVIEKRDRRILELLDSGVSPEEVAHHGIIYPARYHADPWVRMWDLIATRKHLVRLGLWPRRPDPAGGVRRGFS